MFLVVADLLHCKSQLRYDLFKGSSLIVPEPLLRPRDGPLFLFANFLILDGRIDDRFQQPDQRRNLRLRHPVDQFVRVPTIVAHRFQHNPPQVYYVGEPV